MRDSEVETPSEMTLVTGLHSLLSDHGGFPGRGSKNQIAFIAYLKLLQEPRTFARAQPLPTIMVQLHLFSSSLAP
jgi:hypothetical protein